MSQHTDPNESQETKKPTDLLSLAGQGLGLDRDQTLDLVVSLKTDSNALTKFAQINEDLPPEERLQALNELVLIAGTVEKTNALLEEASKKADVARNALYLVGAAQTGSKLAFEPVEGVTSSLNKEYLATQRSIDNMRKAASSLDNSLANLTSRSAEEVEGAVRKIAKLVPLKVAQALNAEVQRVVTRAKHSGTPVSDQEVNQVRNGCTRAIDAEISSLEAFLENNRTRESIAASHSGSVEMSVWSDFTHYFGIDTRDLAESRWELLPKLRKAFKGETWTQRFRQALEIGRDIGSDNIHDVIRHAERGFGRDINLLSVDDEDYSAKEAKLLKEEDLLWDGSEGWT